MTTNTPAFLPLSTTPTCPEGYVADSAYHGWVRAGLHEAQLEYMRLTRGAEQVSHEELVGRKIAEASARLTDDQRKVFAAFLVGLDRQTLPLEALVIGEAFATDPLAADKTFAFYGGTGWARLLMDKARAAAKGGV